MKSNIQEYQKSNIKNMSKKALVIIALSISLVACNKPAEVKEVKTAYVDTSELMKEYTEAKDLEAKYKSKAEEKNWFVLPYSILTEKYR